MTFKAHPVYGRDGHQRRNSAGVPMWKAVAYINGRQRARTFPAKNQRAADVEAERIRSTLRAAAPVVVRHQAGTVGALAADWLDRKRATKSPSTVKGYKGIVASIIARFGTMPVEALTQADVQAWYNELMAAGMKPNTLAHYHSVLRGMLIAAHQANKVPTVAARGTDRPEVIPHRFTLPRDAELLRVLHSLEGDLAVAAWTAALCGLRRGELCGLRWSAIRGREVIVRAAVVEGERGAVVKGTKSGRERSVAVPAFLLSKLAAHRRAQRAIARANGGELAGDWYVLAELAADPTGQTPMRPDRLLRLWESNRGKLRIGLHGLRHWYATKILESGAATVKELSEWMGHAQVSTTMNVYPHADPARRRVSAEVMGKLSAQAANEGSES